MNRQARRVHSNNSKPPDSRDAESTSWSKWLEHWETWNAIVADVKLPTCGLFGCDEKVKFRGKWRCTGCGKITETVA